MLFNDMYAKDRYCSDCKNAVLDRPPLQIKQNGSVPLAGLLNLQIKQPPYKRGTLRFALFAPQHTARVRAKALCCGGERWGFYAK
ncbi:hypothetical protein [Helicobacter sp. NHP22-001]|uniref:hypothetical protein n=1 Tax=Helicobacter sp. NHP22-001 TaxID=3040202 RepID=UPI002556EBF5|nr:hypothetical protein [Helicobacter sp. NHP22-001]